LIILIPLAIDDGETATSIEPKEGFQAKAKQVSR